MGKEDFTKIPHGVTGVQDRMSVIWERGVVCSRTPPPPGLEELSPLEGLGQPQLPFTQKQNKEVLS